MKEKKNHLTRPATYRFMLWYLDPWGNLAHYATTWPNLEEFFLDQQNCFTAGLVLQSPSCCLCCPSDHRAFVWLSQCHKHHVRGGGSKPKVFPELQLSKSSAENTPTIPVLPDGWLCPGKHLIFQFKWKIITPVANDLQLYKQHWPHSRNLVVSWPITAHAKTFS